MPRDDMTSYRMVHYLQYPRSLIKRATTDPIIGHHFMKQVVDDMRPHLLSKGPFRCNGEPGCPHKVMGFSNSPAAWLHIDPPFIRDAVVIPTCMRTECAIVAKQKTDRILRLGNGDSLADSRSRFCQHCRGIETEGKTLLHCARCTATYYCNKECQKLDWKAGHKEKCIPYSGSK